MAKWTSDGRIETTITGTIFFDFFFFCKNNHCLAYQKNCRTGWEHPEVAFNLKLFFITLKKGGILEHTPHLRVSWRPIMRSCLVDLRICMVYLNFWRAKTVHNLVLRKCDVTNITDCSNMLITSCKSTDCESILQEIFLHLLLINDRKYSRSIASCLRHNTIYFINFL